jgi:hypothetical protein
VKTWIIATSIAFGVAVVALMGIRIYTSIGMARGEPWSSLDGPEPVWPAIVGFGALNLIALSAAMLAFLVGISIVRAPLRERMHRRPSVRPGV